MNPADLQDIEIVEDRTAASACQTGFLRLRRLVLRNRYRDGSASRPYPCDIVSRPHTDAVAVCLYQMLDRKVRVLLKESPRAPIYLRKLKAPVIADARPYLSIIELVAGLIETGDERIGGVAGRAAREAAEEAGVEVPAHSIQPLGGESFPSPGVADEKVFFTAAELTTLSGGVPPGDGGAMEEATRPVILDLTEAIRMCRDGRIPDMKTEIGLLRLCDRIGYLPQLGCFLDELPPEWRRRHDRLGLDSI